MAIRAAFCLILIPLLIIFFTLLSCGRIGAKLGRELSQELSETFSKKTHKLKNAKFNPKNKFKYDDLPDPLKESISKVISLPQDGLEKALEGSIQDYIKKKYFNSKNKPEKEVVEIYSFEAIDTSQLLTLDYKYVKSTSSLNVYEMANNSDLDEEVYESYYQLISIDSPYFHFQLIENYGIIDNYQSTEVEESYILKEGVISDISKGDSVLLRPTYDSYRRSLSNHMKRLERKYFIFLKQSLADDILYNSSAIEKIKDWENPVLYILINITPDYSFEQGLILYKDFMEKEYPPKFDYGFIFKAKVLCFATVKPIM